MKKLLKTNMVYVDTLSDIFTDMKESGIAIDSNLLQIPKFEIKKIGHVKKPTFKVDFSCKRMITSLMVTCHVKCKFLGKLGISYMVKAECTFSADSTKERELKTYTYAYIKRMLENDEIILSIRPDDLVFPATSLISGKKLFTKEMRDDSFLTSQMFKPHDMTLFVHQEKIFEKNKTFTDEEIRKYNEIINSSAYR